MPSSGKRKIQAQSPLQQRMELLAEGAAGRPVGPEQSGERRVGDGV